MRLFETIREIKALNKKRKKAKAEIGREEKTDAEKCADALRSIIDDCVDNEVVLDEIAMERMKEIIDNFRRTR